MLFIYLFIFFLGGGGGEEGGWEPEVVETDFLRNLIPLLTVDNSEARWR